MDDSNGIVALNFANRFNPGGGVVKGSLAQEEDLCRTSSLYPSLINEKLYPFNWKEHLIYTDEVVFIKNNNYNDVLPKKASIITASAPDLLRTRYKFHYHNELNNNTELKNINKIIYNVIKNIPTQFKDLSDFIISAKNKTLDIDFFEPFKNMIKASARSAIYHNIKCKGPLKKYLVLGAIGLGAFRLNTDIEKLLLLGGYLDIPYDKKIISLFIEALIEDNVFKKYDEIIFAIPTLSIHDKNYETFVDIFTNINNQINIFDFTVGKI